MNIFDIEASCPLPALTRYNIFHRALEAAEDTGYLDRFVYERALCCYLIEEVLKDELEEGDAELIEGNPIQAWDKFNKGDLVKQLLNTISEENMKYIIDDSIVYFNDYKEYLLSIGGVFNKAEVFSSDVLNQMDSRIDKLVDSEDIQKTLRIADNWGLDLDTTPKTDSDKPPAQDSLF